MSEDWRLSKTAFQFDRDAEREADVYLRWGFDKDATGGITQAYVGLELHVEDRTFSILHYDNSHGQPFHHHSPGFPKSGRIKTELSAIPATEWVAHGRDEIKKNWRSWVNSIVPIDIKSYIASWPEAGQGDPSDQEED